MTNDSVDGWGTVKALILMTGLTLCAVFSMCVKVAFTHPAEPQFADLPHVEMASAGRIPLEPLPGDFEDDERVIYDSMPPDMFAAMDVETRPSLQMAMAGLQGEQQHNHGE